MDERRCEHCDAGEPFAITTMYVEIPSARHWHVVDGDRGIERCTRDDRVAIISIGIAANGHAYGYYRRGGDAGLGSGAAGSIHGVRAWADTIAASLLAHDRVDQVQTIEYAL